MPPFAALLVPFALAAPAPAADARVTCREHAEPSPPGPFVDRGGFRAWTAAVNGARLQLQTPGGAASAQVRLRDRRVSGWKTPFALTAGGDVVVTIVRGGRFEYTKAKTYARSPRSVRFTACPADEPLFGGDGTVGPITGWPGGLYTAQASTCLTLRVTSVRTPGERAATVTVPLGRKRC